MDCHAAMAGKTKLLLDGWLKSGLAGAVTGQATSAGNSTSEPLLKKPEKTDISAIITNPPTLPSIRCTVVPWRLGVFSEHFLPAEFSQSRIDERRGSTACTVISTLVAKGTLEGELVLLRDGK